MDINEFKTTYPDIHSAIFEDGKKEGHAAGLVEGKAAGLEKGKAENQEQAKADGAKAEMERIQSVEAQSIPGHEKLIEQLKFDGETTGEQAAVQILQAEKSLRKTVLTQLDKDAPDAVATVVAPEVETPPGDDSNLPVEDRAKAQWEKDAKLRKEFNSMEAYIAFCKADAKGKARILGK